ncbi:hypothetical protein CY34DRAFT_810445 [Suillus luteus UH-Slu-Lm8-n1]|uniref:Uncharacterized protein n=1 Tax=Suillus luteus UH-Slu-Lm8-n1 TaxID=930992 RepID=A0A0D0AZS8_9AGAM|nr:hypothetical protein CY34DRAFT_810445 [Suillus luteus UH-Slu-Lm8-n1]
MPVSQSSFCMPVLLIVSSTDRFEMDTRTTGCVTSSKFEDLFMHCMQEHPTIREDPRHDKDLEALTPPQARDSSSFTFHVPTPVRLTGMIILCPLEL